MLPVQRPRKLDEPTVRRSAQVKETGLTPVIHPMKHMRMLHSPTAQDGHGHAMVHCAALALMIALCLPASADESRPVSPTPPPAKGIDDLATVRPGLAPLVREGSQIQNAQGMLHEHSATGTWRFTIDPEADGPRQEFVMLPNTHLGDMQQVIRSASARRVRFQVTGDVFVYHGRNYLLVSFPPRVVSEEVVRPSQPKDAEPDGTPDEDESGRSAAEIMGDLERQTGPVGRRAAPPRGGGEDGRMAAGGETIPEKTVVHLRRGRIGRDSGGAWQFIFDADASGKADPPMTLMPCLLLERIEDYARRAGGNAPILISGRVYVHGRRHYLLPTVFQIPFERTELSP